MDDWYVEMGGNYVINGDKIFGRNIFVKLDDIDITRKRFKNRDVFATTFAYNKEDQSESDLYGPLYVDLDFVINNDVDYQLVKRDLAHVVETLIEKYYVPLEFVNIYFSGHKGFHVIVPAEVMDIRPNKELNSIFRFIAVDLKSQTLFKTVDTGIYDNKRLFRLPNSVHSKTELYKVPVDYAFVRASSWDDMKQYASEQHEIDYPEPRRIMNASTKFQMMCKQCRQEKENYSRKSLNIQKGGELLPCIQTILIDGVDQGQRNNTTVALASSLFQNGLEYEEVIKKINEWNSEKNSPRLSEGEIKTTVTSAHGIVLNGKRYGCRAIQGLGLCVKEKCKLYINKKTPKKTGGQYGGSKKRRAIVR